MPKVYWPVANRQSSVNAENHALKTQIAAMPNDEESGSIAINVEPVFEPRLFHVI